MPAIIPVAAYLGAAALYGATSLIASGVFLAASLAVGAYQQRKARRAERDAYNASLRDRNVTVRSSQSPKAVVYGRCVVGGTLVYARAWGTNSEMLSLVVALQPGHEITEIEQIYFNDEALGTLDISGYVTSGRYSGNAETAERRQFISTQSASQAINTGYTVVGGSAFASYTYVNEQNGQITDELPIVSVVGSTITVDTSGVPVGAYFDLQYRWLATGQYVQVVKYLGTSSQGADPTLVANSGGEWTAEHRGRGQPYVVLHLKYNEDVFPTGVPNFKFLIKGKKVYDPRTATTAYSNNPALCVRDYLTSAMGFGCSSGEIDDALIIAAANLCDEQVELGIGGPYQDRYTCDGVLSTESGRLDNLEMLARSMAGLATFSQGKWKVYAGAYRVPTLTLTDDDLTDRESIAIQARASRRELFNAVKGTYVAPDQNWQPVDYPIVTNSMYETEDGGQRLYADIPLPLTTDSMMAQRLAKIALEQSRQSMMVRASFNLKAYKLAPGDTVQLDIDRYGFSSKVFRVVEREFSISDGVKLTLAEEASAVYDWNYGLATQTDPAPNTTLPNPFYVAPPAGVTLATGDAHFLLLGDGTRIARILVSWSAISDVGVTQGGGIEIEYRSSTDDDWRSIPRVDGSATSAYIAPVQEQLFYSVRVRAINGLGVRSSWVYPEPIFISTKQAVPGDVETFSLSVGLSGIRLFSWSMSIAPADLDAFEIRYQVGGGAFNWGSAAPFAVVPAAAYGNQWTYETFDPPEGQYSFGIKAIDTSGNYSANAKTIIDFVLGTEPTLDTKSAFAYLYQWSMSVPGNPSGGSTYVWATGTNTNYTGGNGWSTTIPSNPGTAGLQLWQASKQIVDYLTATNTAVSWATGFSVASIGANGAAGLQTAQADCYRWAVSIPAAPTGSATWSWGSSSYGAAPSGWSTTPGTAPSPGYTLWRSRVLILDTAGVSTTAFTWTGSSVSAVGYAGSQGASARYCYSRIAGNPTPVSGNVTASGDTRPSQSQSASTWGLNVVWYASDPNPSSTDTLYQSDGIFDPAANQTVWSTPYISSLKVGSLSAVSTNTGSLTVTGTIRASTAEISGTTMTGSGQVVYADGRFAVGSSSRNITYNGSAITLNGPIVVAGNIAFGAVSANVATNSGYSESYGTWNPLTFNVSGPTLICSGGWVRVTAMGWLSFTAQSNASQFLQVSLYLTDNGSLYGFNRQVTRLTQSSMDVPISFSHIYQLAGSHNMGIRVEVQCLGGTYVTRYGYEITNFSMQEIKV